MRFARCASVFALLLAVCAVTADDKKMDMAAMGKKMMDHAAPTEAHKVLDKFVGNWNYTGKMWMEAGAPEIPLTGTADNKSAFGGRFLHMHVVGADPQMPFEGSGVWGYDKTKKKYVFSWVDTMNTAIMTGEGSYDKAKNTMTWESECYCPIREKKVAMREVIEFKPDGAIHSVAYAKDGGKEYKAMEMNYTKAK